MKPLLSICIPTFNRARLLDESLATLAAQCTDRPVEICVSNNASMDETTTVLASYPTVHHQTQQSNIGIDRNIMAALGMARGKYVLPIGDDELLIARGIDSILAHLDHNPDVLMLNGWHRSRPHLSAKLQGRIITTPREAFELLWDKMPLGGFVARRDYAASRYSDRYLGTHHAYSGALWDYLLDLDQVHIECMAHPTVEFREVRKSYAAYSHVIHFKEIPRWFDLIPPYYAEVVRPSKRKHKRECLKPLALLRFGATWLRSYA
jgi:glycosyltransferase involved in cell wall biosynthesis